MWPPDVPDAFRVLCSVSNAKHNFYIWASTWGLRLKIVMIVMIESS